MGRYSGIQNFDNLKKEIEAMKKAPQKVLNGVMGDFRKRGPGWVATEVVKHYGVSKKDITSGAIGQTKVKGDSITNAQLVYTGRPLTLTHFKLTPKVPGQNAYSLKAEIIKGQRVTFGKVKKLTKKQRANIGKNFRRQGTRNSPNSPVMLMHTGNRKEGGTDYIPFQRKKQDRDSVEAIKGVSLPQMVSSPRTELDIRSSLNTNLGKRLDHYMDRYMGD